MDEAQLIANEADVREDVAPDAAIHGGNADTGIHVLHVVSC